jgi:quinol monooxygenase YgiN
MYTIYVTFKAIPGKREEFIRRVYAAGVVDAIRAEDGCIQYDYYYSEKDPDEILLIEAWESRRHQEIHITQPHMDTLRSIKSECITDTKLGEFVLK